MRSKLFYTQLFGILSLMVILLVFVPRYMSKIPKKLIEDVQDNLHKNSLSWVAVRAEGRDIILSGIAPTIASHHQAVEIAEKVVGVKIVHDKISPTVIVPYSMNIEYRNNALTFKGYMPSNESKEKLFTRVSENYPNHKIIKKVDIGTGEPKDWDALVLIVSLLFQELDLGVVNIVDNKVTFSGKCQTTEQKNKVLKYLEDFKSKGFTMQNRIVAMDEAAQVCQQKFDTLLSTSKIEFQAGKSQVKESSHSLLKGLVDISSLCPNVKIEIIGHTDSKGDDIKNQELSEERAKSVVVKLFQLGIPLEQMEAIGRGELAPIASNETNEGRATNRRIEFKVRGY